MMLKKRLSESNRFPEKRPAMTTVHKTSELVSRRKNIFALEGGDGGTLIGDSRVYGEGEFLKSTS